ncbi:MAG: glutamate--cysteine ligase, partial [Nevskiales bacterium]
CPTAAGILLVPESHTRNRFYLESLATLAGLIRKAGFKLRIGSLSDEIGAAQTLTLDSGRELVLEPLRREGDRIYVDDFSPCAVLLNNDLSGGRPPLLEGLEQPVIPPLGLGWSNRLKSQHFALYREVVEEFATRIDIDPWLVDPMFRNCGQINFMKREGEDCLAGNVAMLLEEIREKYQEYGIEREPYVVVKADAGTYGMAVMSVKSPDELRDMNRKQRTRMAALKEGREVTGAIIQEGVYTNETWGPNRAPAEPVVYMIDHYVVGGFYRIHGNKESDGILNSPGMEFQPLAFAHSCTTPDRAQAIDAEPNRFYAYGVVARLALLAAAREVAQQQTPAAV